VHGIVMTRWLNDPSLAFNGAHHPKITFHSGKFRCSSSSSSGEVKRSNRVKTSHTNDVVRTQLISNNLRVHEQVIRVIQSYHQQVLGIWVNYAVIVLLYNNIGRRRCFGGHGWIRQLKHNNCVRVQENECNPCI